MDRLMITTFMDPRKCLHWPFFRSIWIAKPSNCQGYRKLVLSHFDAWFMFCGTLLLLPCRFTSMSQQVQGRRWCILLVLYPSTSGPSLLNKLEFPNLQFLVHFFPLTVMCWWACVAEFHKRKIAVTPYVKGWKQRFLIPLAKICNSLLLCHSSKERCVEDIGFYARNCICYQL